MNRNYWRLRRFDTSQDFLKKFSGLYLRNRCKVSGVLVSNFLGGMINDINSYGALFLDFRTHGVTWICYHCYDGHIRHLYYARTFPKNEQKVPYKRKGYNFFFVSMSVFKCRYAIEIRKARNKESKKKKTQRKIL